MAKKGPYTEDKYQFKFNFINQVPPGVMLVSKNVLTGEVKNVEVGDPGISKTLGLKAMMTTWFPWIKTKYVSSLSETVDYKEFGYTTKDKAVVMIDIACEVRIVDAAKYEFVSASINKQLKVIIDSAIRKAISNKTVDELLDTNFNLYNEIKPELDNFKDTYGVEISRVDLQNLKLPAKIRENYETSLATDAIKKVGEAEAYVKKQASDVEIAKIKAQSEVEIAKIKAELDAKADLKKKESDVEIDQLARLLEIIKNSSKEDLEALAKIAPAMLLDNSKQLFVHSNSSDVSNETLATPNTPKKK